MAPLIGIGVANDAARAQFVAIPEFFRARGHFDHRLADLLGLHRGADGREKPIQKLLAQMRLFIGRPDVVGPVGSLAVSDGRPFS